MVGVGSFGNVRRWVNGWCRKYLNSIQFTKYGWNDFMPNDSNNIEWSSEFHKCSRNSIYFLIFSIIAGYAEIGSPASIFGLKIENFSQPYLFYFVFIVGTYWMVVGAFRVVEEWPKLIGGYRQLKEQLLLNKSTLRKIVSGIDELKTAAIVHDYAEYMDESSRQLVALRDYEEFDIKKGRKLQNPYYRMQSLEKTFCRIKVEMGNLSEDLQISITLLSQTKALTKIEFSAVIRLFILELFVPVVLYLLAISAFYFGNYDASLG